MRVTIVLRRAGVTWGRMNWLDLLIVGILAWTVFRAFAAGLIRELVTLITLVAGIVLTGAFYDDLAANLEFVIADPTTRSLAAIFIGVNIAGFLLASVMSTAASLLFLGPLDKLGGAVFGLVKGLLLVQVLLIAISVFPAQMALAQAARESTLAPIFLRFAPAISIALPEEFQQPLEHLRDAPLGSLPGLPGSIPGFPTPGKPTP